MATTAKPAEQKAKQPTQEQIVNGFNSMREQQRQLVGKISEITDERKEYQLVIETLKVTEKDRTCYRMVGGVLVQRSVGDVLPTLEHSIEQMSMLLKTLEKQVEEKGKDLVTYREKYNIRLQNEPPSEPSDKQKSQEDSKSSGVLVNS